MNFINTIKRLVPGSPSAEIDWDEIDKLFAATCFSEMKTTPQNPVHHGEGDVYTHTQMVCRALAGDPDFHRLNERKKAGLFLAALLHDIGKVRTTKQEDGNWISPRHSETGSRIAREFLWRDCGLSGEPEQVSFRETVCALVRCHMLPVHLLGNDDAERRAREIAAIGELAADFTWELLCMLTKADVRGRIADDIEEGIAQVELAGVIADDAGCLSGPCFFGSSYTKRAYLSGRNVQPQQELFDDTWGEVILLSGLPGTGKDTWCKANYPGFPVVSLDDIRQKLQVRPTENQGRVIQAAQESAREHLRKKESFIWNATNLTKDTRRKLVSLFERYGARVRIVYLETDWNTRVERNLGRKDAVPETVVERMLKNTVLPTAEEAQSVEWVFV